MKQPCSGIAVKLFAGYNLTSEMKMHLNQSIAWKLDAIHSGQEGSKLIEVHFQGKDYIGCHLNADGLSLEELKKVETLISERLHAYCPDFSFENMKLWIFSQVFVA